MSQMLSPDVGTLISSLCFGRRILDIGCGCGGTLSIIASKADGAVLTGIEPDVERANIAEKVCPVMRCRAEDAELPECSFDTVILQCVKSVLDDPALVLSKIHRALRPGGTLIISDIFTPLEGSFISDFKLCGRIEPKSKIESDAESAGFFPESFSDETSALLGMAGQMIMDGAGCDSLSLLRRAKARYGVWKFRRGGLCGVVTAAGLSSRMGDFKPLLKIRGESMISGCVSMMERAGAERIAVVTGFRGDDIRRELEGRSRVTFCENSGFRENNMFDSVKLGLNAVSDAERVMVCPVDVPLVKDSTVSAILEQNVDFVRPVCRGKFGHPVLLCGRIGEIRSYEGEGGLRGAVDALGLNVSDVEVDDVSMTMDADTPEDYERLRRMGEET